jgi:hypothetical protein
MAGAQVLIIESNFQDKAHLFNEFLKHKLQNSMKFAEDEEEALSNINFFHKDKGFEGMPQIILLNFTIKGIEFVKKIRSDLRYRAVKIYLMVKKEQPKVDQGEILFQNNVSGLIIKPLRFKLIDSLSYLDAFSLYLDLIKIQ